MKRFILAALILLFAVVAIKILSFKEMGNQPEQKLMKQEREDAGASDAFEVTGENSVGQEAAEEKGQTGEPEKIEELGSTEPGEVEIVPLFEGFGDMDYALFLETNVGYGVSLDYFKYGIYGDFVDTVREGEEIYFQLCETMLGTEISWKTHEDWAENMETLHIQNLSPDLQWIVARKYLTMEAYDGHYRDEVIYGGEIMAEAESFWYITDTYFYFKKTGEGTYAPMSDMLLEKREQLGAELGGYITAIDLKEATCLDEYGKYLAIAAPDSHSIWLYSTEDWDLKRNISIENVDEEYPLAISQFVGDEGSGWLVFSNGASTYRLEYPGGKPEKIGEFMFDTTYSPDGKYLAYCTGNIVFCEFSKLLEEGDEKGHEKIGRLYDEWDEIPPGWYIREIETGNTVYIPIETWEQDHRPLYGGRCIWIEKDKLSGILDSFETGQNNNYSCIAVEDGFEITFYSNANKEILSEYYPKKPAIRQISENIFEIRIRVGSPAAYAFYVDTDNAEESETFFNPLYIGDGCVAYMEDGKLVLKDIFHEELLYMVISRDFSQTADPMSAIIAIELQDRETIALSYFKGEDYEETSETISILGGIG